MFASVYLESATEPISGDGPYEVNLIGTRSSTRRVTVNPVGPADTTVSFKLRVDDVASFLGVVPPPFSASGYEVTCSLDGGGVRTVPGRRDATRSPRPQAPTPSM